MQVFSIIHPDGWRFVGLFAIITAFLSLISTVMFWVGVVLTIWCFYFFRNPKRVTPILSNVVLSPADGKVVMIKEMRAPEELDLPDIPYHRISIFLNVFDVHVNRVPVSGIVKKIHYHAGRFFNASLDKASEFNERNSIVVECTHHEKKIEIGFVQIAGLIARRIRCDITEGERVEAGEPYGLIRFGSRMDIYLPKDVSIFVCVGQKMVAGETVLADFDSEEPQRQGRIMERV